VNHELGEKGQVEKGEAPSKKRKKRKKVDREDLDLSAVAGKIPTTALKEYIEYRKTHSVHRKFKLSQLALIRYANAVEKSAEICAIPAEWVVRYGIHREWRTVDPEWIKKSIAGIRMLYGEIETAIAIPEENNSKKMTPRQAYMTDLGDILEAISDKGEMP
jgi:hypothetical protein